MKLTPSIFLVISFLCCNSIFSQLNIQHAVDIPMSCGALPMTMLHDQIGRDYLYVAQKSGGLTIYDISTINTPILVDSIPINSLDTLDVMSLSQKGNYLYLALGNFFNGGNQYSGMAIIDVTTPSSAIITDIWKHATPGQGAGFVALEGNYAYLAAMGNGLITFDVSDKNNIVFLSQLVPSINFPDPSPDPNKYNARGMAVKNDIVYLAYDAGGLRIINVTDKLNPAQNGQYSLPVLNGKPRAYNNIILDDSLVYVTIDYCGLEILNVSDTTNITQVGWWNPWGCPSNNWFTSTGHTNELAYDKNCEVLFMSTGKSEMYAVDISNPAQPDSIAVFGNTTNNLGTWGVSQHNNQLFLSYICTLGIPFPGNWAGVKALTYDNNCSTGISEELEKIEIKIYPNPTSNKTTIDFEEYDLNHAYYQIINLLGEIIETQPITKKQQLLNLSYFDQGVYFIKFTNHSGSQTLKLIKD
ncbi:MAG: T9SS type A sorting domain-containing protein [Vicingus serpentipes]|nr:T9SS type A sorting domain-containing protein [Vicingus serpentipes]